MIPLRTKLAFIYSLFFFSAAAQDESFRYWRELKSSSGQWNSIELPNDLFSKIKSDYSDIRILGITGSSDTIEAPFIHRTKKENTTVKKADFKIINSSKSTDGYYITFVNVYSDSINEIMLDFGQENFDWRVSLEGSHEQKKWFTILDDYRILSIHNDLVNFEFTRIAVPPSSYHYLRLHIRSSIQPRLESASLSLNTVTEGVYKTYAPVKTVVSTNKKDKQTEIEIDLGRLVPAGVISVGIADTFDYYRTVHIVKLTDSVRTEKGYVHNYEPVYSGTINSFQPNVFRFSEQLVQHIKVVIEDGNNQPLVVDSITVKGYLHFLVARFTQPADYFLAYGNPYAVSPDYDIHRFPEKIPMDAPELSMGPELDRPSIPAARRSPLFENKAWLWTIMLVIIAVLGWFTFKMLRKT